MSGQDKLEKLIRTARDSAEELKTYLSTVTNIDLCDKDFGDGGVKVLADALFSNTTITTIAIIVTSFYGNEIGAKGAKALDNALSINTTITNINIHGRNIRKKVANC